MVTEDRREVHAFELSAGVLACLAVHTDGLGYQTRQETSTGVNPYDTTSTGVNPYDETSKLTERA